MTAPRHLPLVEVTRGRIVESVHYGSLCAACPDGSILLSLGDADTKFFLRSSAKPFQALAFLERGGAEYYRLEDREIALICASHSGTEAHIQALEALQKKVGIDETYLQCGAHLPYSQKSADQLLIKGITPRPNHNNCSGKHTGMLAFAKMIGAPMDNYLEPSHPVQQAILNTFAEMCGLDVAEIEHGIDGCTAPVFAVPLANAAAAYARLCQPEGLPENRAKACRLISAAMPAHPDMVAGPERFDTDGMTVGKSAFISKVGAEGYRALGVMPGKARRIDTSLGITMKISDGDPNLRAGAVVAMAVLKALKVLDDTQSAVLKAYDRQPVANWRGKEIGEIRPTPELMQALAGLG
ncbi:MAG: asparaginase [Anaerolineaceae bacterium]|nr:asparaginase [Anaerolineaceae bacterium]